jgi:hypothetical protein
MAAARNWSASKLERGHRRNGIRSLFGHEPRDLHNMAIETEVLQPATPAYRMRIISMDSNGWLMIDLDTSSSNTDDMEHLM